MTRITRISAGTAMLAALVAPASALAHAGLEGTYPANGASVSTSIKRVSVTFDEAVTTGTLSVRTSGGTAVPVTVRHRGAKITGTLERRLGKGRYRVSWRVRSDDGHRESGSFSFRVR